MTKTEAKWKAKDLFMLHGTTATYALEDDPDLTPIEKEMVEDALNQVKESVERHLGFVAGSFGWG